MRPRKPDSRKPRSAPSSRPARPVGKEGKRPRFGEERSETRSARPEKNAGRPPHKGADQRKGKYPARPNRDDGRRDDARWDGPPREARPKREASWQKPREHGPGREAPRPPRPERRDDRRPEAPQQKRELQGRDRADYGRGPDQRLRDQRSRDRSGRPDLPVWLYGSHACLAALSNPERSFRRLLLTREAREALQDELPANPQPEIVDRLRLESLLPPGAVHQGIALLVDPLDDGGIESLREELPEEFSGGRDIVLLLDHVTDPRNIGAILRSAAAFGARAVVVTDRHAPEATGALAKAASGALEIVPLIRVTNLARALDQLAEYGYWRVGLEMETDKTLAEAVHDIRRTALVLGAEDEGLRRLTREKCDFLAKLPMTGAIESLNVSAAAAVALYECVRG